MEKKILLTDCPDSRGLIAKITNICYKHQLNIVHNNEYVDNVTGQFFMRTELEGIFNDETFLLDIDQALPPGSQRKLVLEPKKKVVILVTKEAHCIGDILIKAYSGAMNIEISAVIGNHDTLGTLIEKFDIPFHYVSHEGLSRGEHEDKMLSIIHSYAPEYVVLAKYMRVLTPEFVEQFPKESSIFITVSYLLSLVQNRISKLMIVV